MRCFKIQIQAIYMKTIKGDLRNKGDKGKLHSKKRIKILKPLISRFLNKTRQGYFILKDIFPESIYRVSIALCLCGFQVGYQDRYLRLRGQILTLLEKYFNFRGEKQKFQFVNTIRTNTYDFDCVVCIKFEENTHYKTLYPL